MKLITQEKFEILNKFILGVDLANKINDGWINVTVS